jgi:hypothetical protein
VVSIVVDRDESGRLDDVSFEGLHNLHLFFLPCEGCAFVSEVGEEKRQVFEWKALCVVGAFRAVLKDGREVVSCTVSGMALVNGLASVAIKQPCRGCGRNCGGSVVHVLSWLQLLTLVTGPRIAARRREEMARRGTVYKKC